MSSGSPKRVMFCSLTMRAITASVEMPCCFAATSIRAICRSVRTGPGLTALTCTPSTMPSSAIALVKDRHAALTEPPMVKCAPGVRPPAPMMLTMEPWRFFSSGHAARVSRTVQKYLSANPSVNCSSVNERKSPRCVAPALLTTMSMPPNSLIVAAASFAGASGSRRSSATNDAWPRPFLISPTVCSQILGSRDAIITAAPSRARSCATARPMPRLPPVTMAIFPESAGMRCSSLPSVGAGEVRGVVRIARPFILRVKRPGAERARAFREGGAGRDHVIGRLALFDPVHHRGQEIEIVERRPAPAMPHAGHGKKPARLRAHLVHAARGRGHALVIIERVERREPRIAPAVVIENLAAMTEEAGEIGPARRVGQALHPVAVDAVGDLVDIDGLIERLIYRAVSAAGEDAGDEALERDAGVIGERGIGRRAARIPRPGERGLERVDLLRAEAGIILGALALQRRRVEMALPGVEDHAVRDAVGGVAGFDDGVDHELLLARRKRLRRLRLARRILRRDLGEGMIEPREAEIGMARVHRVIARHDAVEIAGIALRRQHALAPAGGAAGEIGMRRGLAVVARDDGLGDARDLAHRSVGEI